MSDPKPHWRAHFFVLRAPRLPADAVAREGLRSLAGRADVREAVGHASPDLGRALALWLEQPDHPHAQRVPESLYRYLWRMARRPTPFGLFASNSLGRIGDKTQLRVAQTLWRHSRLDMGWMNDLVHAVEPMLRPKLVYQANNSLYRSVDQLRYAEGRTDPRTQVRRNHLVSLTRTPAIDAVVDAAPATLAELARAVAALHPELPAEDTVAFVEGLIDAAVLHSALSPWLADGRVWRWSLDTYQPELDRYGGAVGMALAERLFEADSDAVVALVPLLSGDEGADARWRLALRSAHALLEDLGIPLSERVSLLLSGKAEHAARFQTDKAFEGRLRQRFRQERPSLESLLEPDWAEEHPLAPGLEILSARSAANTAAVADLREAEAAGQLARPISALAGSYVHMAINRLLRSEANAVEGVLYDFLARLYRSRGARRSPGSHGPPAPPGSEPAPTSPPLSPPASPGRG